MSISDEIKKQYIEMRGDSDPVVSRPRPRLLIGGGFPLVSIEQVSTYFWISPTNLEKEKLKKVIVEKDNKKLIFYYLIDIIKYLEK